MVTGIVPWGAGAATPVMGVVSSKTMASGTGGVGEVSGWKAAGVWGFRTNGVTELSPSCWVRNDVGETYVVV